METHCGGAHFDLLIPKTCNICGWRPGTKRFMAPGKYATGTITGQYKAGGIINLEYEATTNHKGYFLVKLCTKVQSTKSDPAQSCFDSKILKTIQGKDTYPQGRGRWHKWAVKIPQDVSCKHCILQVDWKAGNQGRCIDLVDCPAKRQEHFVTCSDIRIEGGTVVNDGEEGKCPKTHKYVYNKGKWCCNTNKDCNDNQLKMSSDCCQYSAYKECPFMKCQNHGSVNQDPTTPCKDKKKHCPYWRKQGYCTKVHVRYMKTNCKKSCNFCDAV